MARVIIAPWGGDGLRSRGLLTLVAASAILAWAAATASGQPLHITYPGHFKQPPTTAQCESSIGIACYNPAQFEQAYNLNPLYHAGLDGAGKTIVIVDSFGSPTIQNDLAQFDDDNNLPAPPSFKVITPAGPVPPYDPTNGTMGGWAIETSLDVEYSHAIAPGANILLVETPVAETEGTTGFPEIVEAENYVINHDLGDVISQSFGATEQTFPSARSIYCATRRLPECVGASRDRARLLRRRRTDRQHLGWSRLLPVPGEQLAVVRPACDLGRRAPAPPRRQRQPHRA